MIFPKVVSMLLLCLIYLFLENMQCRITDSISFDYSFEQRSKDLVDAINEHFIPDSLGIRENLPKVSERIQHIYGMNQRLAMERGSFCVLFSTYMPDFSSFLGSASFLPLGFIRH